MAANALLTVAAAATAGALLIAIAWRAKLPSIALLLIGGVLVGPEVLGWVDPASLGEGLRLIVSAAVAVILFEGGLTLDVADYRRASVTIGRLLTVGALITWIGSTLAVAWLLELDVSTALVAGSLVIVTGPTVVSPLLRRIGVVQRIHSILYWEAVLIDAVGVFVAVMSFEWLTETSLTSAIVPTGHFILRFGVGAGIGVLAGFLIGLALRYDLVPDDYRNILVLAGALMTFAAADAVLHEAGILSVIVAGMVVSALKPRYLRELKRFKLELTELGIGVLFVLLAANLRIDQFRAAGLGLIGAVAVVLLVLRPLSVLIATRGQGYSLKEKLFLSWIAPRGIVAASMASLFGIELTVLGNPHGPTIEAFVFAVIAATVLLQGLSAPWVARLLGVRKPPRKMCLVVAEETLAVELVSAIREAGASARALVPLQRRIGSQADDAEALSADPLDSEVTEDPRLAEIGMVMALTPDPYFNQLVCHRWAGAVGREQCFAWAPDSGGAFDDMGRSVWTSLQLQHAGLSLADRVTSVDVVPISNEREYRGKSAWETPLLHVAGDVVTFLEGDADAQIRAAGSLIVLRRRIRGLRALIRSATFLSESPDGLEEVVDHLLESAQHDIPGLPAEEIRHDAVRAEVFASADASALLALPHAYHSMVDRSRAYIAVIEPGVEVAGQRVHLVCLVLSPAGKPDEHLEALAAIAQLVSDRTYLGRLAEQRSASEIMEVVHERA